jgi:hypothetical protein
MSSPAKGKIDAFSAISSIVDSVGNPDNTLQWKMGVFDSQLELVLAQSEQQREARRNYAST